MNSKAMKIIGPIVSILGIALPAISGYLDDRKMKDEIAKQVSEAIAKNSK